MPRRNWDDLSPSERGRLYGQGISPGQWESGRAKIPRRETRSFTGFGSPTNPGFDPGHDADDREYWRQRGIQNYDRVFGGQSDFRKNRNRVVEHFDIDDPSNKRYLSTGAMRSAALANEEELKRLASRSGDEFASGYNPFWYHSELV